MFVHWLLVVFISFIQLTSNIARPQGFGTPQPAFDGATDDSFLIILVTKLNTGLNQIEAANNAGNLLVIKDIAVDLRKLIPTLDQVVIAIANNANRVTDSRIAQDLTATRDTVLSDNYSIADNLYILSFCWPIPALVTYYVGQVRTQMAGAAQQFAEIRKKGASDTTIA